MRLFHAGQVFVLAAALLAVPSAGWASADGVAGVREGFRARFTAILVARHSGKCLEVLRSAVEDGADVQQRTCDGGANQMWNLTATNAGYYTVRAMHSGKCLHVLDGDLRSGANIRQWACVSGRYSEEWRLGQRANGYFVLVSRHSGKCLDMQGGGTGDGTNALQWTCVRGRASQEWRLV
ncbi:RICIN domain-containing protein [Streptosporangium sp. NPDC049644]|uniref:RICIN domain-containing protein n=1 Tax=Streptosporangium sp. NPDC049644 TaxID=3155507 RepID=UPI0034243105